MKIRILVLTSIILLACKLVSAQEINWGVKVKVNMSTLKTELNGEKYILGYHFGLSNKESNLFFNY
ncbi:hypothetical protein NA63_0135 [Flavobacteriaceae bacterium MAR_2010_105]|nr:hypothetical protein NA63_0135 [Flavobacteriaceae bacterium MAR_2010_105]